MNGSCPKDHTALRGRLWDFSTPFPSSSLRQELQRFFFKPIQFDLQLSDLAIKLIDKLLIILILFLPPVCEEIRKGFEKLLFPFADLVGMNFKGTGQLSQRLLSLDRFQGHLGSKCRIITFSHIDHITIPPPRLWQVKYHLIALSSFWGVVQGFLELAEDETIFFDEIGDISLNLQAKLLRVIERR